MSKSKRRKPRTSYAQIINPIHHLERMIQKNDKENDRSQAKILLLTILSVILAGVGIFLALFYER